MTQDPYVSLKQEMIEKCRLLEKIAYFIGTWGNVSARIPEGFLVTPSRVQYTVIEPGDFVTVSLGGT